MFDLFASYIPIFDVDNIGINLKVQNFYIFFIFPQIILSNSIVIQLIR